MSTTENSPDWSLVVPVKLLARAKSRLAETAGPRRPALALAVASDTVTAALRSARVRGVVVVTDDPLAAAELERIGAVVVPDEPDSGLNPALAYGALVARESFPGVAVGAMSADLPALRPAELTRVLTAADQQPRAFVPDALGVGTTLYTALPGEPFSPAFGRNSRARHRESGAAELLLENIDSVRQDVDTLADLRAALALGVGDRTARVAALIGLPASPEPHGPQEPREPREPRALQGHQEPREAQAAAAGETSRE